VLSEEAANRHFIVVGLDPTRDKDLPHDEHTNHYNTKTFQCSCFCTVNLTFTSMLLFLWRLLFSHTWMCHKRSREIRREWWDLVNNLIPPHLCVCSKEGFIFLSSPFLCLGLWGLFFGVVLLLCLIILLTTIQPFYF
jgi:hypothetical protein